MMSRSVKVALRALIVLLVWVCLALTGFVFGKRYVINQEVKLKEFKRQIDHGDVVFDQNTEGAIPISIVDGDSTSDIAQRLYDKKLINSPLIFSILSKMNGFSQYVAGTHYITPGLGWSEMMYLLTQKPNSVTITFSEGITYEEIKDKLHKSGLVFSDEELDKCMNSPYMFVDYDFVSDLEIDDERDYLLAGYLFPDTYEFDINANEKEIVNTFLRNINVKVYKEYYCREQEMSMSLDDAIILASIIQCEAPDAGDMALVSSVFHNRLNSKDASLRKLSSDAPLNFLRKKNGMRSLMNLPEEDINSDSPYNTYIHEGLPPGAICMPGIPAIQAALYPETTNYYYFCAVGDGKNLAYANTSAEHKKNCDKYSEKWQQIDAIAEDETSTDEEEQ